MNIELNPKDKRYIEDRINAGKFQNPGDVIHHAFEVLRRMKDSLDAELLAGLASGPTVPLAADWKQRVRRDAAAKAEAIRRKLA